MGRRSSAARWAWATILGVVVYVALDVALVFLRPRFSVLHSAESDYGSKGSYAWVMDLNFLLRCALSLTAVRSLMLVVADRRRLRIGLALIAVWAVTSGLLAFFPDDPAGTTQTGTGKAHLAIAFVAFVAVAVGTRVASSALLREPDSKPVSRVLTAVSWIALVPVLLLGHAHLRPRSLGGLYEKLFLAIELLWLLVAAARVTRLVHEEVPAADVVPAR